MFAYVCFGRIENQTNVSIIDGAHSSNYNLGYFLYWKCSIDCLRNCLIWNLEFCMNKWRVRFGAFKNMLKCRHLNHFLTVFMFFSSYLYMHLPMMVLLLIFWNSNSNSNIKLCWMHRNVDIFDTLCWCLSKDTVLFEIIWHFQRLCLEMYGAGAF